MSTNSKDSLPGPLTLWPDHWAGGWGERSVLPNRIRISEKDRSGELAYIEHHGDTGMWNARYPTEADYRFARFLLAAYNSYHENCGTEAARLAEEDLLGAAIEALQDIAYMPLKHDEALDHKMQAIAAAVIAKLNPEKKENPHV